LQTIVSQSEASKILGIHQSAIARYLKKSVIKRYEKSKVCIEEIQELRKTDIRSISKSPQQKPPPPKKEPTPAESEDIKSSASKMTYTVARTHREAYNAKLAEVAYKEKIGELITIEKAKGVIEVMFSPLSQKLDDVHIDLKSRFPEIPMEAINWLNNYINTIKKSVNEYEWEKKI